MILTFTPNPSIDVTMHLPGPLTRGEVIRVAAVSRVAGGKGINVAQAVAAAGRPTLALFPAQPGDPLLPLIDATALPARALPSTGPVRTNTTVTEPDGTTTKLNGPGPALDAATRALLKRSLVDAIRTHHPSWVVLAGSLPPGTPADWYATLVRGLRPSFPGVRFAVDTSDAAIRALGTALRETSLLGMSVVPHLIKPNGMELGQLVGVDGACFEDAATRGDFAPVLDAADRAIARGIELVLVTLGAAGAVLVTADGAWAASPPPIQVASTVGAGDSSLAGFLLAHTAGLAHDACLAHAVAYGSAAAALPGTTLPTPDHIDLDHTHVTRLR